jgi:hypothetical protein
VLLVPAPNRQSAFVTNSRVQPTTLFLLALLLAFQLRAEPSRAETTTPVETASLRGNQELAPEVWTLPAKLHHWARFPIGAWREVEITTETFDAEGKLAGQSITTQKEVLKAVTDDTYVLEVQATVDVSGKRIEGPWNTRVLKLATDRPHAILASNHKGVEQLEIESGAVECQIWEVQYTEDGRNLLEQISFSDQTYPYVWKRDVFASSENSPLQGLPLDSMTTTARSVPFSLEGRIIECASQYSTRRRDKGDSQILALVSAEIPGGEVSSRVTDFDTNGNRIRWSVLKLLSYGDSPSPSSPAVSTPPIVSGSK